MTEQERVAASAENYRRMRAELDRRLSLDPELRKLSKKIRNGKADFNDTFRYSEIVSKYLGEIMQENIGTITNPLGKEYVCKELLRDHYEAINDVLGEVQVALDEELGIHLNPVKAPRNDERIAQVAHALEDPTVKPETIRRRAKAPVVNTAMSMHDDYIRVNAKLRNDLGLKPILQRFGTGCCSWCSAVAGKWRFGEQPEDVFRRHDNCDCVIIYDTQVLRGAETEDGGRSKTWQEVDPREVAAQGFQPRVFTEQEARELEERVENRLTLGGKRDIMDATHKMGVPKQQPPDFSLYTVKEDPDAVDAVKRMMVDELGIPEDKIDLTGIKNADVLEPFMKRWKRIQNETGMSFPYVQAVEIIDSDPTCVAGVPDNTDRFYISSKFFNSKEALLDTLKDWAEKDIMPKQCKSIAFIAEHEAAHIRIPDELLNTDEAYTIWKRRKLTNDNDFDIYEFFADITAIFRLNKNTEDASVLKAVNYLVEGGVSL